MHSRVARLETTLLALLETVATTEGLPKGFKEKLIKDTQQHLAAVKVERFQKAYGTDMESWNKHFAGLPQKS
ncbi:hypothetical protein XhhCFBP4925_12005 [Xanthomonas hortorum pv. hederae]|nr:hypothetical protein XhhCFBP4925_12005 [Xanthomonas hortorum pv. hederae]RFF51711.1 hypothetical protein D0A35_05495 [Xanthomonas campestris]